MTLPSPSKPLSSATALEPPAGVGAGLRALRRERGLSLSTVARATGISASFLSLVENGRSDITIGRLVRLVDFYDISIVDLLPPSQPADELVVRESERPQLRSPAEGIDVFLLAADTRRAMMPMLLSFGPAAELAERGRHEGEEFVYVVEGRLELDVEGSAPQVLARGDSAYYAADRSHFFRNADRERPLFVICVDTPPNL
ncbi:MAG: helix-turn-helix domain-containing protein [Gaiellaceae bacterium]